MSKKIVAMLMAVAMAFSLLPVTALAGNGTQTPANATQPRNGRYRGWRTHFKES